MLSFRKVLLNNKPLNLIDDKGIPDLQPEIVTDSDNLELSSGDIGFWVIPDAKVNRRRFQTLRLKHSINATITEW